MPGWDAFKIGPTIVVEGIDETAAKARQLGVNAQQELKDTLTDAAELVRDRAARKFAKYSISSAATFTTRVWRNDAFVQQSRRKTTGKRPDWGALQVSRAMVPALRDSRKEIQERLDRVVDDIAHDFNRAGLNG